MVQHCTLHTRLSPTPVRSQYISMCGASCKTKGFTSWLVSPPAKPPAFTSKRGRGNHAGCGGWYRKWVKNNPGLSLMQLLVQSKPWPFRSSLSFVTSDKARAWDAPEVHLVAKYASINPSIRSLLQRRRHKRRQIPSFQGSWGSSQKAHTSTNAKEFRD